MHTASDRVSTSHADAQQGGDAADDSSDASPQVVRAFLVGRFSLSRRVLQLLLELDPAIKVVGGADTVQECLAQLVVLRPDAVVLETQDRSGKELDLLMTAQGVCPGIRVLVIAGDYGEGTSLNATRMGVSAYLPMSVEPEHLRQVVRDARGGAAVPQGVTALMVRLAQRPSLSAHPVTLTPREREVLCRLAEGLTDKQIAMQLSVAASTVKIHLRSVYQKLGLRNRAQAAVYAAAHGLLDGYTSGAGPRVAPTHS